MERLILVTGGARSGKSTYALECAKAVPGKKIFIATAVPFDDEMRVRIRKHMAERSQDGFTTVEAPYDLAEAVRNIPVDTVVTVVDCLTVWLGNLHHAHSDDDKALSRVVDEFLGAVRDCRSHIIFVTNEVGCGIVPENALARKFRDEQGLLNRKLAALCDTVCLVVCGIPMNLTPRPPLLKERGRKNIRKARPLRKGDPLGRPTKKKG